MPQPPRRPRPSLGSRLLRHLMLPLTLIWALGAAVAALTGEVFVQQAFDREMLDNAYVVGSHVRDDGGRLELGLTQEEVEAVLFDQSETVYFAVLRDDGTLVAGQRGLESAALPASGATHAFSTIRRDGQRLRAVVLRKDGAPGFRVVVAQTTLAYTELLLRRLGYSIVPQIVLLALLAWGLRRVVRHDLEPLAELQRTLDRRDAGDLTPVPAPLAAEATSREVERVGVAINALLGRISDGVRAQREFAGNVAHELRTPLAGIRALAEYGLAQGDPQALRRQLQAIVDSQSRASRLVDQLLALALADESRDGLALAPVALGAVARDVVLRMLPRADQLGADLGASGLEQPARVLADTALLEGMLGNLIDNALRHGRSPDGEPPVVTVELAREDGEARLSVTDDGPGLDAQERGAMLQRWAQGPRARPAGEGAGLGMAIVARYAELLHARFELDTAPQGRGLRASLIFRTLPD
jgi:two-component system sensor histidine kinase TctE